MPADPAPPGFIGYKRGMMVSPLYSMIDNSRSALIISSIREFV